MADRERLRKAVEDAQDALRIALDELETAAEAVDDPGGTWTSEMFEEACNAAFEQNGTKQDWLKGETLFWWHRLLSGWPVRLVAHRALADSDEKTEGKALHMEVAMALHVAASNQLFVDNFRGLLLYGDKETRSALLESMAEDIVEAFREFFNPHNNPNIISDRLALVVAKSVYVTMLRTRGGLY